MKVVKSGLILLLTWIILIIANHSVFAAENSVLPIGKINSIINANHFSRDWSVTLGVKAWHHEWDLPVELRTDDKTQILEFESGGELSYIPTFLTRYHNFFIGGSYLPETEYDFPEQQIHHLFIGNNNEMEGSTRHLTMSGSRTEYDLNAGYFLMPNLAISLGYKSLERKLTLINSWAYDERYYGSAPYPLNTHAPIVGLAAAASLNRQLNLYGNLAYGWLSGSAAYKYLEEDEIGSSDFDLKGRYTLVELGLTYIVPLPSKVIPIISILAAFRSQRLEIRFKDKEWGHSGDQHDATAGFLLGVNVAL